MVAARLADLKRGANRDSQGLPIDRAADLLNVGERTVARAREVLSRGVPDLLSAVERGEVAVSAAANICGMSEAEQREMVASVPDTRTGDAEGPTKNRRKRAKREAAGTEKSMRRLSATWCRPSKPSASGLSWRQRPSVCATSHMSSKPRAR